jgi:hypothetical protein
MANCSQKLAEALRNLLFGHLGEPNAQKRLIRHADIIPMLLAKSEPTGKRAEKRELPGAAVI